MYRGERFNGYSHLAGTVLAAAGASALLSSRVLDAWKLTGIGIYGATLLVLFAVSTLYHSTRGRTKAVLRKLDYCAIYLLIAGTYTPFALVTLRGAWGWSLLGAVWTLALLGIVQEIWLAKGARVLSLVIYVIMGWLALVAVSPLWLALKPSGFALLAAGGALYTVGMLFYATDHKLRHGHGVWHLFVLGGSACHFFTVLLHVA